MTVGELITKLQQFDPNAPVTVNLGRNELANGREARTVAVVRAYRVDDMPFRWATAWNDDDADPFTLYANVVSITG